METTKPEQEITEISAFTERLPQTNVHPVADRIALGKELRERTPRKLQATWTPPSDRADPVALLIENSKGRVEDLIPLRYGRMMATPFTFYRGAAAIMAYDLAHTPSTGLHVQACGDCHLLNFGGFATAERRVIFDINDFDETSPAPWEWDVKRLAASFVIAGRANGFKAADCRQAAWNAAQSYRQQMAAYAEMPALEVWYHALEWNWILQNMKDEKMKQFYSKKLAAATEQGVREKEFAKLAFAAGDRPRIIDHPPLIFHTGDQRDEEFRQTIEKTWVNYLESLSPDKHLLLQRYHLVDAAFKVVGVGSVGTFCGILLLMSGKDDPLFLQFKQANKSVLEPYAGASPYPHSGQRVVAGQRLMQAAGDMFLGWATGTGADHRHHYLRQLADAKIKPVVEIMKPFNLINYAGLCGWALARAHARSGDTVVLSSYMGKSTAFEDALADFSEAYADQNERDHAALVAAVRNGKIEARTE
jgi:uncharacterized protein (DUF2252 family)